jgi:predicted nucleotidyltransferase
VARYEAEVSSPAVSTLERLLRAAGQELVLATRDVRPIDLSGDRMAALRRHRVEVLRLARAAGATNVRVFGSVVRGDDDLDSDIDLLVDYDVADGLMPIVELKRALEELLGARVDIAPTVLLKAPVARSALAEAIPL